MTNKKSEYNFSKGFSNLDREYIKFKIGESDKLPKWLEGFLLKVGPAHFTIGKTQVNHWFDGLAMIYKFEISDGEILFSNSFIKSNQYIGHQKGKMLYDEFGTKAPLSIFEKIKNIYKIIKGLDVISPSCNVNISKINSNFIAMTETSNNISFNPDDLSTLGKTRYADELTGQITLAHPIYDTALKETFNLMVEITGRKIKYKIYKIELSNVDSSDNEIHRKLLTEFEKPYLSYSHSFFLTNNYIILYSGPLHTSTTKLLFKPFNEALEYKQSFGSEFIVIDRKTGNIRFLLAEPFIFAHGINSYEDEENSIVIDLIVHENMNDNPYRQFSIKNLSNNSINMSTAFSRYVLDLNTGKVRCNLLPNNTIEFPVINPNYHMRNYEYFWANYRDESRPNDLLNGIIKQSINSTLDTKKWHEAGCYPSEPSFIPDPISNNESEGVLISLVYDSYRHISFLLFLDAKYMTEIVRFDLPCHIPFTLHGNFYKLL